MMCMHETQGGGEEQDYQSYPTGVCAKEKCMQKGGCNQQLCAITFFSPTPLALLDLMLGGRSAAST